MSDEQDFDDEHNEPEGTFETFSVQFNMHGRSGLEFVLNSSTRYDVTAPEYKILERIHGRDFLKVIQGTAGEGLVITERAPIPAQGKKKAADKTRPRLQSEELERLRGWYGPKVVSDVYPGEYPELPFSYAEAKIRTKPSRNVVQLSAAHGDAESPEAQKKLAEALAEQKANKK